MELKLLITAIVSAFFTSIIFLALNRFKIIRASQKAETIIKEAENERKNLVDLAYKEAEDLKNKFISSAKEEINKYREEEIGRAHV